MKKQNRLRTVNIQRGLNSDKFYSHKFNFHKGQIKLVLVTEGSIDYGCPPALRHVVGVGNDMVNGLVDDVVNNLINNRDREAGIW